MIKRYRQHPIAIITGVVKELKGYAFPLLLFLVLRSIGETGGQFFDRTLIIILAISVTSSLVFGFLRWFFYTITYNEKAITIDSGVFIKKHREIKRERIHTMNKEANVIWQWLNLVSLNIETPGTLGEAEVTLTAIPKPLALDIQATLHGEIQMDPETTQERSETLNSKQLIMAGATSGSVGIIFAVILALIAQLMVFIPSRIIAFVSSIFTHTDFVILIGFFVIGLILSWVLSVIRFSLQYAYFTVRDHDDSLEITRGLFVKRQLNIKKNRIQAVVMVEGILRQPFHYASLQLVVAGGVSESSQTAIVHPFIKKHLIDTFLDTFLPGYTIQKTFKHSPRRARKRFMIRASILPVMTIGLMFIRHEFLILTVCFLITAFFLAYFRHNDTAYAVDDHFVYLQFRNIAKSTAVIKKNRVQHYQNSANPMQRLRKLRHVSCTVMASPSSINFHVKDLGLVDAEVLRTAMMQRNA